MWLWDQPGVRGISQLEEKLGRRSRPPLAAARITKNTLPRILTNVSIVDAIRNSCAHGTLEETETEFVFTNIDPRNRSDTLQFGLSWSDTAAVGESLFWILNDERWWKAPVHKVRRRKS
ncbi:MAG: hypothetical protein IPG04_38380 [Polyangiaceae bacterium]|nr:hypothetical protein [Polyangiaceae bacterium]